MKNKKKYFGIITALIMAIVLYFNMDYRVEKYGVSALSLFDHEFYLKKDVSSGPYIFKHDSLYIIKWLDKGKIVIDTTTISKFGGIQNEIIPDLDTSWFKLNQEFIPNFTQEFSTTEKVIALSDIHGQNKVFLNLLTTYKIIDNKQNWIFGKNHLVINGDIFDRGENTCDALWLLYKLEKQAEKVGGKVHITLGNHEMMILKKDLRYIHEVDQISAEKFNPSSTIFNYI